MKSFFAILLAGIFMIQTASKLLIIANYEINKEYITNTFCENKAKPKMNCNGKCHLKKQLQKEDKKENPTSNSAKEKTEILFFPEKKQAETLVAEIQKSRLNSTYLLSNYSTQLLSVFHPPQA